MRKKKRFCGVLMVIAALIIMQLPVSEADAETSASDFQMEGTTLVAYRGSDARVTVPSTVEVIGEGAFENNDRIETVIVPNSVTQIEEYAFWGCDRLNTVTLGNGLSEVGDYAFSGAKGLEKMTIPGNVTRIGIGAFADCVNLRDITIPYQVSSIHETAFDGCAKLEIHSVTGSYAERYAQAFYERQKEMPEYEDVSDYPQTDEGEETDKDADKDTGASVGGDRIPNRDDGVQIRPEVLYPDGDVLGSSYVVGNQAVVFMDNTSPQVLTGEPITPVVQDGEENSTGGAKSDVQSAAGSGIPKYTIVDGRIVADQAYYRNGALQAVTLPEGTEIIGQFAFARSSLSQIVVPEGTEEIDYGAFYHCDSLTQVSLPSTLVNVEPKAFAHSAWVDGFLSGAGEEGDFLISGGTLAAYRGNGSQVEIPEGVTLIAAEVFQDHTEITDVTFPESLRVIGEGAFEGCSGLTAVTFGGQVTDIKDRAFAGTALEHVALPATLDRIGLQAFPEGTGVGYEGVAPQKIHEISAERLSNESYRSPSPESGQPGVVVEGLDGAAAQMEGAVRNYTLSVWEVTDERRADAARAFERNLRQPMPEDIQLYEMSLTDNSGIPINKTGRQLLTVTLPVPERFADTGVQMVLMDRNGQLESVPVMRLYVDGVDCVRFDTSFLSTYGIYGDGTALNPDYVIQTTTLNDMAAPDADADSGNLADSGTSMGGGTLAGGGVPRILKWLIGTAFLLTGMFLLAGSFVKNRI